MPRIGLRWHCAARFSNKPRTSEHKYQPGTIVSNCRAIDLSRQCRHEDHSSDHHLLFTGNLYCCELNGDT
jgi:hypothetical protein